MDNFGKNLKTLRKKMGLTQQELALKLGVRKTTVSNYETSFSSPPKDVLVEIARFFDVRLDELLGVETAPEKNNSLKSRAFEDAKRPGFVNIFSSISSNDNFVDTKKLIDVINLSNTLPRGQYFGVSAPDDSLSMRSINKGDYIIFSADKIPENGNIVAAAVNDEPVFYGIYHETQNEISILPASFGGEFTPHFFQKSNNSLKILGVAVRAIINL